MKNKKKQYNNDKFYYIVNGIKKEPRESDFYFNSEWKFISKFPFITKKIIVYKLINNNWIEQ